MEIIIKLKSGRRVRIVLPNDKAVSSDQLALMVKWASEGKSAELALD
jgi:hypothetical protein